MSLSISTDSFSPRLPTSIIVLDQKPMEDQKPITVMKTNLFMPRQLRRRMNFYWAPKIPINPAIEVKIRKMKRNIIHHARICARDVYAHRKVFIEKRDKLDGNRSLVKISELMDAGICTQKKLRNTIYNRMIQEAADVQFRDAEERAASEYFIQETVEAAQHAKQAAAAAVAAEEAVTAAQFAKEAAEAAELAKGAAENARLAKRTMETYKNAKLAREAANAAKVAKTAAEEIAKEAAAAQLVDDEATPEESVVEEKLGRLSLESCKGDE